MTSRSSLPLFVLLAGLSAGAVQPAERSPAAPAVPPERVRVVAGPEYKAGALHQWLMGEHYRELWTTPIEVEVLNLAAEQGGLTPKEKGGSMETKSLKLRAADGREFRFRSVNKDPVKILRPEMRVGVAQDVVRDQIRSQVPAGALPVARLAEAAGLLHATPRLFVMPDDAALGEFRKDFAGLLGMLEETPQTKSPVTAGLEDFDEVEDWKDLVKRLDKGPRDRVDTRAFLKARLFDLWIGDWDRHDKQWNWARRRGTSDWYPIPKDRDHALSDFDGLILSIVRHHQPRLLRFTKDYPDNMLGMGWNSRVIDRRLLAGAEWPLWAELVAELQQEMTDAVIRQALATLPAAYQQVGGARLANTLQVRRQKLPEGARAFYRMLAEDAEVQATDADDQLEIVHPTENNHSVELRLSSVEADGGTRQLTYFRRQYRADETDEVRVYLRGGDDRVVSTGPGSSGIKVRVIGGPGDDVLDDSAAGHTVFYDHEGDNRVIKGPGTRYDRKPYVEREDPAGGPAADWGGQTFPIVTADAGGDIGLLLGLGLRHQSYGFRKNPYASRYTLSGAYATGRQGFRVDFLGEHNRTGRGKRWEILARASQIELVRFYGLGNETPGGDSQFFKADQGLLLFRPRYHRGSDRAGLWLGPVAKLSHVDPGLNRFIGLTRPYGIGDFGQVGVGASLLTDTRRQPTGLETGLRLRLDGNYYPKVWSVTQAFGEAHGDLSVYLTAPIPLRPTLALRAGGRQVFGDLFPFYESAFVGGPDTVRGLSRNRFAGERAVFGNAELRLPLGEVKVMVPIGLGVFGLADAGRVWVDGEQSDQWHTAVGGGLWLSLYKPQYLVSVSVAQDESRNRRVYFQGGLSF